MQVANKIPDALYSFQLLLEVPFVIKQRSKEEGNRLLYDGRFLRKAPSGEPYSKQFGTWHLLFGADGHLIKQSKKPSSCPKNHFLPKNTDPTIRLAQLVSVPDDGSKDPKTHEETAAWLSARGLRDRVKINFCVRVLPTPMSVYWIYHERVPGTPRSGDLIFLEAFTGKNHSLLFRNIPQTPEKRGPKPSPPKSPTQAEGEGGRESSASSLVAKPNRACGAHVDLSGLTKALKLGMLAGGEDFLLAANSELCKAVATLWLHYDSSAEVRHVGYRDGLGFYASFEIFPGYFTSGLGEDIKTKETADKSWHSWKALFDCVWERRKALLAHKEKFIGPVVAAWTLPTAGSKKNGSGKRMGGSYNQCVTSLRVCLNKVKVICFSGSDLLVHSLKVPLAHYLATVLGVKGGLTLRTVGNTKIVSLVARELEIENAANILGLKSCDVENPFKDDGEELLSVWREWTLNPSLATPLLPPKPLIDAKARNLTPHTIAYTPCRVSDKKVSPQMCVQQRAAALTAVTLSLYQEFCTWVCRSYALDLTTCPYTSLSSLAFKCVWLSLSHKGGATYQSLEKSKPAYVDVLRKLSRGGFAYSFRGSLSSGEPVVEGGEPAVSVREYDLTSAYGYSMRNMSVPGGFCVGYAASPEICDSASTEIRLTRTDKVNRAAGFEFSATFKMCSLLEQGGDTILAAWSNYSPLGLCYVGKYPLDLVAVLESGAVHFVNFDGQFAHGCRTGECRPLPRYASDKSLASILAGTRERDQNLQAWVQENNAAGRLQCFYHVFSSCHDADFNLRALRDPVRYPDLALLRQPYDHLPRGDITSADFFSSVPDDLTYLLVGRGAVPEERRRRRSTVATGGGRGGEPPLLVWKRAGGDRFYQDFGWETEEDALFTKDTLEFLSSNFGFQLTRVTHCFFYRKCTVLPRVFGNLTRERQNLADKGLAAKAKFTKSLVNYSTGMFGYNPEKWAGGGGACTYRSARLLSQLTRWTTKDLTKRRVTFVAQAGDKGYFILQSKGGLGPPKASSVALPIYASVVEYGKARLAECHSFISRCVKPGSYRVLYSNTDNLVCALSSASLEGIVRDDRREAFERKKKYYFGNAPGLLSEKWSLQSPPSAWSFASPYPCNYSAVVAPDPHSREPPSSRCKSSGFANLCPEEAHAANQRLLAGSTEDTFHPQKRRLNRLANMDTRDVAIQAPKLQKLT